MRLNEILTGHFVGVHELARFFMTATEEQKQTYHKLLKQNKQAAWDFALKVLNIRSTPAPT